MMGQWLVAINDSKMEQAGGRTINDNWFRVATWHPKSILAIRRPQITIQGQGDSYPVYISGNDLQVIVVQTAGTKRLSPQLLIHKVNTNIIQKSVHVWLVYVSSWLYKNPWSIASYIATVHTYYSYIWTTICT